MMEERHDGMTQGPDWKGKPLSVADLSKLTQNVYQKMTPEWKMLVMLDLLKSTCLQLRDYVQTDKAGSFWRNPFAQMEYEVALVEEGPPPGIPVGLRALVAKGPPPDQDPAPKNPTSYTELGYRVKNLPDFSEPTLMQTLTRKVLIRRVKPLMADGRFSDYQILLPSALSAEIDGLPESEREAKLTELALGVVGFVDLKAAGTVDTPTGRQTYAVALVFAVRPLSMNVEEGRAKYPLFVKEDRAFYPIQIGLNFTEGNPSAWYEEDRQSLFTQLLKAIDDLAAPYLKEYGDHPRLKPTKADRINLGRADYFKAPGRLLDTPRNAAARGDIPAIGRWYLQTAFNRTVGMAAAALTKMDTRESILDWQSATVEEVEDLVYCRSEEGAPAHGQHREDILRAFEALRAIPVPIVQIDWKQIGTGRNPRWVKQYKLRVGSLLQSYGAVFVEKKTGKRVFADDPARKKDVVKSKPDRRKTVKALVSQNPADGILESFPADRFTLTGFEWRWNTDIAEDFICPQVALDKKDQPRLKLKGGRHIEGSRFINLNRRYFPVQKHLRAAGSKYAPRLLDLIVSEKTHITRRGKGAVWIEIQADKVIKWLGLWMEYKVRSTHVLEEHVAPAVMALIREKVMLPDSWLVPQLDPNPDRRKTPFYRWKVAELWSTVALVTPEEAKDIEGELVAEAEAAEAALSQPPTPCPKDVEVALPGLEEPPALPIPSGPDIRTAREAAGLNLRRFAESIEGGSFNTWARYERGEAIKVGSIKPDAWQRVRDFIEKNRPKETL